MNTIGFPGFGIGPFTINRVAFTVPFIGLDILWYAVILTASILCGIFYTFWRAKKSEGVSTDDITDVAIFTVPAAIIGARIYYVIFNFGNFRTVASMFNTRAGGLAIYGAIIASAAVAFAVCRFKSRKSKGRTLSTLKVFDAAAPGIMLGQIIGRWGNFVGAEAHGTATELPWRMSILGVGEVHPTFLYESLWNLLGFAIVNLIYHRKKFSGQIFLTYITWYGFGRMLIEGLRTDSLMLGDLRVSQVLGGLCFVAGLILIIWLTGKAKIKELENDPGYQAVYSAALAKITEASAEAEITVAEAAEPVPENTETKENTENTGNTENSEETEPEAEPETGTHN